MNVCRASLMIDEVGGGECLQRQERRHKGGRRREPHSLNPCRMSAGAGSPITRNSLSQLHRLLLKSFWIVQTEGCLSGLRRKRGRNGLHRKVHHPPSSQCGAGSVLEQVNVHHVTQWRTHYVQRWPWLVESGRTEARQGLSVSWDVGNESCV